ncbi:glycoside hydrolase family 30 protein [Limnovirga soli]|nr:glycoside hydrolase family 30 beta sandwich domain-containing protein [Limnovirga soli]
MKIRMRYFFTLLFFSVLGCAKSNGGTTNNGNTGNNGNTDTAKKGLPLSFWVTTGNQTALLQKHTDIYFGTTANNFPFIDVDSTKTFQTIDGFGFTLTGGSAAVINSLNAADKAALLQELFATTGNTAIGISYLRISIGASDLNATVFSYDDMPAGQTDETMAHFSLANDATDLIPLLKEILAINPAIKIIATPWSAPVWMKDNGSTTGGSLLPAYYAAYASYFVKYIQAMQAQGIGITAVTPQNEPLNPNNNPSLYMTALQQAAFIKNNLGPAFQQAGISTKIVAYDHNCDVAAYPLAVLADAAANAYTDGSAFHLYAGDISALSSVHNSYPDKNIYFTEQYTASSGDFGGDLNWHIKNVVIGSMRNWSRNALEWNLANDAAYGPHTPGGCTTCKGALTINGNVTRNVAYYIIAHASKFVPAGSVRIESTISGNLNNVAFLTPAGKKVLLVQNTGSEVASFNIRYKSSWVPTTLAGGAVATYTW